MKPNITGSFQPVEHKFPELDVGKRARLATHLDRHGPYHPHDIVAAGWEQGVQDAADSLPDLYSEADVAQLLAERDALIAAIQCHINTAEQASFDDWLDTRRTSGDASEVQYQWSTSREYEDVNNDLKWAYAALSAIK